MERETLLGITAEDIGKRIAALRYTELKLVHPLGTNEYTVNFVPGRQYKSTPKPDIESE